MTAERVLLVFLDGVGIGGLEPESNPFLRAHMPGLARLWGDAPPTGAEPARSGPSGFAFPLDASLGVAGLPQSGTGQAALLTGIDAAAAFGGHFGPWVPVRLRPKVEEESVLRMVARTGASVAFANAYPRGWPGPGGSRRIAGPPLAARGAGVLDRHEDELARGEAVSSEIINDGWRTQLGQTHVPPIEPEAAGRNLAGIATQHRLTLYAHYATDTAGHSRNMRVAVEALERVDRFLTGTLDALDSGTLLLVASDHGNLEDIREGHTRNPALGLAAGPGAGEAAAMRDLRQVTPFIRKLLGA